MKNEFSFTLVESTDYTTDIFFSKKNKDTIELLLDSYDFEFEDHDTRFTINEPINDIYDELTGLEMDETQILLNEEDEGFYLTPMDEVFEIEFISIGSSESNVLNEGIPKRTLVIRKGKRKILFKCGPGQMKVGRSCRRRPTSQLNKMKRRAKISARKARKRRQIAGRKRKISMRRRALLVHKPTKPKINTQKPKSRH
jgi:hypothetical protein